MSKRVFFSFHYQDVIDFRANVVRNHKTTKHQGAGYFDASIWEDAKKESDLALKRLINGELKNTSVTAVLIMKSVERENLLLGIHINAIKDKSGKVKTKGPNPFDYLGVEISSDGKKLSLIEKKGDKWYYYKDLDGWNISGINSTQWGKSFTLSNYYNIKVYDWVTNDGYNNFDKWIE